MKVTFVKIFKRRIIIADSGIRYSVHLFQADKCSLVSNDRDGLS